MLNLGVCMLRALACNLRGCMPRIPRCCSCACAHARSRPHPTEEDVGGLLFHILGQVPDLIITFAFSRLRFCCAVVVPCVRGDLCRQWPTRWRLRLFAQVRVLARAPRQARSSRVGSALKLRSGALWQCGRGPYAPTRVPSAATTCTSRPSSTRPTPREIPTTLVYQLPGAAAATSFIWTASSAG
jgi:hypothetical protein